MNKELALRTFGYLIGHYKIHDETTINSQEIEAIEFILKDNEDLEHQVKKQKEVIDKATNDIQEIIDNINDKTIISLGQFIPKLEIIQDELNGSNDILKEVEK